VFSGASLVGGTVVAGGIAIAGALADVGTVGAVGDTPVMGSLEDTAGYATQPGYNVLYTENYNPGVQERSWEV